MIQAVLRNAAHPEYGEATIPFPIPEEEYGHCLELLEALEADCAVRPSAFDASFSREQLAAFVLDSLLGQMSRGADNCEGLEQVLRRLLYR